MGMFDWVNVDITCKKCGGKCSSQSKNGSCTFEVVEPQTVNAFHAWCGTCKIMYSYNREPTPQPTCREKPYTEDEIKDMGFSLVE